MKIQIPFSFNLGPHKYDVKFEKGLVQQENLLGQHLTNQRIIRLQAYDSSMNNPPSEYMQTFYHEKVHAILQLMGEEELNNKEKFVDLFASLLLQTDQTAEFFKGDKESND